MSLTSQNDASSSTKKEWGSLGRASKLPLRTEPFKVPTADPAQSVVEETLHRSGKRHVEGAPTPKAPGRADVGPLEGSHSDLPPDLHAEPPSPDPSSDPSPDPSPDPSSSDPSSSDPISKDA